MKIFVVGAGQVGTTIVEALHVEHDLVVFDLDSARLGTLSYRFDVVCVEGNGASRRVLQEAGVADADLVIACTSRDEVNIVAATFARRLSRARTIVRTTNVEYLEAWQERELDVDFVVSSELETAHAVSRIIGVPAAKQTDVFADGKVQIVEFDVPEEHRLQYGVVGRKLREAAIPPDSKLAAIIRGGRAIVPRGEESIIPGDRIVVIGSPEAARAWSEVMAQGEKPADDVVIFGAGRTGLQVARVLIDQDIRVRLVEASAARAEQVAEELERARVFHATGIDPEFIERERIGQARAAIFAMRDDAKNLYAAVLAKTHGVGFTIAVADEPSSIAVFDAAGVDVAINPRSVTAEEIVRFAHDPRIRQLAMLEGDRFEVLDIVVRPESELVGRPFHELPMTGSLIGAIVRNGEAIFPHGDDMLQPGDRAIIFTESSRVAAVEQAL